MLSCGLVRKLWEAGCNGTSEWTTASTTQQSHSFVSIVLVEKLSNVEGLALLQDTSNSLLAISLWFMQAPQEGPQGEACLPFVQNEHDEKVLSPA